MLDLALCYSIQGFADLRSFKTVSVTFCLLETILKIDVKAWEKKYKNTRDLLGHQIHLCARPQQFSVTNSPS